MRTNDEEEPKPFGLKLAMNKHGTKVMLAEVESDFADILSSFLTRPIGAILRSLQHHYQDKTPKIGSLTTLYNSLSNLSTDHFLTKLSKEMVLNPRSSFDPEYRKMKLDIGCDDAQKYFTCENWSCPYPRYSNISMYSDVQRCSCGKSLNRAVGIEEEDDSEASGVFLKSSSSFVISDDLMLLPNVGALSVVGTLRRLGIAEIDEFELRDVNIGYNEVMDLLKGLLVSRTPLTDLILGQESVDDWKYVRGARVLDQEEEEASLNSEKKMVLKVVLHRKDSGNKLLFAQVDQDFVNFLCSLMIIPLGGVESLLCSNTCIATMDNLYKSVVHAMDDKYFANPDMKTRLKNLNSSLDEDENASRLFYHRDMELGKEWLSSSNKDGNAALITTTCAIECLKGNIGTYVKGPKRYIVTDDLTVAPLSITLSLYVVNQMKIPLSEIKEIEVEVGQEEALSILKASLTSNCAITNGLMANRKIRRRLTRKRKASRISKASN